MSVFNLTYATTNKVVSVLRQALAGDPLFRPDKTGPSRSAETIVMDAWGYQVRDFPVVIVTGVPGANRRMDLGDRVRPFYGAVLTEEGPGAQTLRTFDVQTFIQPGTIIDLRYSGPDADQMNPVGPWAVPVQEKIVAGNPVHFVELNGPNVGPASAFPLVSFEASARSTATGKVYGGWYDLSVEVSVVSRSTQTRDLLADRVWSLLWFLKKPALRALGVVVLDVRHTGFGQDAYGADQIYQSKFSVSCATEFESIVLFPGESVQDVDVQAHAMEPLT